MFFLWHRLRRSLLLVSSLRGGHFLPSRRDPPQGIPFGVKSRGKDILKRAPAPPNSTTFPYFCLFKRQRTSLKSPPLPKINHSSSFTASNTRPPRVFSPSADFSFLHLPLAVVILKGFKTMVISCTSKPFSGPVALVSLAWSKHFTANCIVITVV